ASRSALRSSCLTSREFLPMRSHSSSSFWRSKPWWCNPLNDARRAGGSELLDVRIVRKAYAAATGQPLEVLRDIAFTLARGELGVLVGPSGCGKTTMLRIIAGIDVDYDGKVVAPERGRLAMVFQEPRLLPWRTVEDNVWLVAPSISESALVTLFDVLELAQHR